MGSSPQPFLIEVSSEAGRKIGGIYTVIASKARFLRQALGDRYLFIGFWDESCAQEVRLDSPPAHLAPLLSELGEMGIFCHYGLWTAAEDTPVILVDAKTFANRPFEWSENGTPRRDSQANHIKFMLWKHYGVDSLMEPSWDFSENAVWGWAVGKLIARLAQIAPYRDACLIGQFHEWISASALLHLHHHQVPIATVFTTHATVLGRSMAAAGVDVLAQAANARQPIELSAAYRLKVEGKHQLEAAAAKYADIFTTVSDSVGTEVRYILGREPDLITLNGLDLRRIADETRVRHLTSYVRQELLQLCESALAPYYSARYDQALLTFISGRYEFTNKGFDIYIQALGLLNAALKQNASNDGRQVLAFIFAPTSVSGPRLSVVRNYLLLDKIHEVLDAAGVDGVPTYRNLEARIAAAPASLRADLQQMTHGFIRDGDRPRPDLFELRSHNDEVMRSLAAAGLRNGPEDPVKVFFYPTYLRPDDGLLAMPYRDVISGFDVGIFPSRYEPFGYTPLEAALAFDLPVSTDAAGFGRYLRANADLSGTEAKVLSMGAGGAAAAQELAEYLQHLYHLDSAALCARKEAAYSLMSLFDWSKLVRNYLQAYQLAARKHFDQSIELSLPDPSADSTARAEPPCAPLLASAPISSSAPSLSGSLAAPTLPSAGRPTRARVDPAGPAPGVQRPRPTLPTAAKRRKPPLALSPHRSHPTASKRPAASKRRSPKK